MKNPEYPCPTWWVAPCVDGDRCVVHADCERCLDAGHTYAVPGEEIKDVMIDGDWARWRKPCEACPAGLRQSVDPK
jgi:hypothetical protein